MSIHSRMSELSGKIKALGGKAFKNQRLELAGRSQEFRAKIERKLDEVRTIDKHDQPMR